MTAVLTLLLLPCLYSPTLNERTSEDPCDPGGRNPRRVLIKVDGAQLTDATRERLESFGFDLGGGDSAEELTFVLPPHLVELWDEVSPKLEGVTEPAIVANALPADYTPTDPYYESGHLYWVDRLKAIEAWKIRRSTNVKIVTLDTKYHTEHNDLAICLAKDGLNFISGELRSDVTCRPDPRSFHYETHGTAVAGILAAEPSNGKGVCGVCWEGLVTPYTVLEDASRVGLVADAIAAIQCAKSANADIIVCPWGGLETEGLKEAISAAPEILFVVSAGNDTKNLDVLEPEIYPAGLGDELDNVIVVAATRQRSISLHPMTNWGAKTVHVAAPGWNIVSTVPKRVRGVATSDYDTIAGTSAAAAFVAGAAALAMSENHELTPKDVREFIMKTATPLLRSDRGKIKSGGELNMHRLLVKIPKPKTPNPRALKPKRPKKDD